MWAKVFDYRKFFIILFGAIGSKYLAIFIICIEIETEHFWLVMITTCRLHNFNL